jgi:DNA-binding NarL/FixJ family response regulator
MSAKRGVVTPDQRSPADGSVSTRLTARTTQEFIELHELNEAELKVLGKVVKGLSNAEISAELGFSEKTVKNRLNGIRDKLGTGNRTRMAVLAVHWRLCPP